MAFSGSPIIVTEGKTAIINQFDNDTTDIRVRITYKDSSNGDALTFASSDNLVTNFNFGSSSMEIGAADLNVEFIIDEGDEVTKAELRFTDSSGTVTMDEYIETGAIYTYGGKYVVTGWEIIITSV